MDIHEQNNDAKDRFLVQQSPMSQSMSGTGIQISWKDIRIQTIPKAGCCGKKDVSMEPKVILDGVSGSVLPGQFLSIIGASGAGKTTLLNFLSGRLISQNLDK